MDEKRPCPRCAAPVAPVAAACPSCGVRLYGAEVAVMVSRDEEHLKMLAVFWYVKAGMSALFGCFPIIHLILGIVLVAAPESMRDKSGEGPPPWFGFIFIGAAFVFILMGWTSAVLQFLTARNLARRRRKTFCTVVAAVTCLWMPLGTILGVFTLVVLSRPTVQSLFAPSDPR